MSESTTHRILHLRDAYSRPLLEEVYNSLMIPNFGQLESELEPLEVWYNQFESDPVEQSYIMHVIFAIPLREPPPGQLPDIIGGVCCEYYPASNCGLMTYIAVSPTAKKTGVSRLLVTSVLDTLTSTSRKHGHPEGCAAIFLETNTDTVNPAHDVMVPRTRRLILHRLGFRVLKFTYVQPRLSDEQEKCHDLYLSVHESYLRDMDSDKKGLASEVLLGFLHEFYIIYQSETAVRDDPDFVKAKSWLLERTIVEAHGEPM